MMNQNTWSCLCWSKKMSAVGTCKSNMNSKMCVLCLTQSNSTNSCFCLWNIFLTVHEMSLLFPSTFFKQLVKLANALVPEVCKNFINTTSAAVTKNRLFVWWCLTPFAVCLMVFNPIRNNISVILWRSLKI